MPRSRLEGRHSERLVRGTPVGHQNIYKILRGELPGRSHLETIVREAEEIVNNALSWPRRIAASRLDPVHCRGDAMNTTRKLHELGQSIWLDNITRELLNEGTLRRYIDELS